jgi:hypothetical protein
MLEFRLETLHGRNYNTTGRPARPLDSCASGRYHWSLRGSLGGATMRTGPWIMTEIRSVMNSCFCASPKLGYRRGFGVKSENVG